MARGTARADGQLFPPIEPFTRDWLEVGDGHRVYFEQCGNPNGVPLVFLHGGPGSGCIPAHRQLVDPERFRVVLFDQRGCGRSTPRGGIDANTTARLTEDIERLRAHLEIERWLVFGGSWGSSLALAYCAHHPAACLGAILRGVFLTGKADLDWFFHGAREHRPEAWARLAAHTGTREAAGITAHYLDAVRSPDRAAALRAVACWVDWEAALSAPDPAATARPAPSGAALDAALDKYRIQAHYLANACFIGEVEALRLATTLSARVPTAIVHGAQDLVCRAENAVRLQRAIAGSHLRLVAGAGHSPFEPAVALALISAAACFHQHGDFAAWGAAAAA
jgi:proline iminopeptidase